MDWRTQIDAQVDAIIKEQDLFQKLLLVRTLDDLFEGYYYYPRPPAEDVLPGMVRLFDYALEYVFQDRELKKQQEKQVLRNIDAWIFVTLKNASLCYGLVKHIDVNKLIEALPRLPVGVLQEALSLLSSSKDEAYIPIIEQYSKHPNQGVRLRVRDILKDMKDAIAYEKSKHQAK